MIRTKYTRLVGYLDPLSKFLLLPWTFFNLKHCLELSFPRVTSYYGLLLSFFFVGRVLGRSFKYHTQLPPLSPILILLSCGYFMLGVTSRFSIICSSYVLIGFSGGLLRSICFPPTDDILSSKVITSRRRKSESNYNDASILCLIFAPLFVGFFYSTSITTQNPPLIVCSVFAAVCFILATRLLLIETNCLGFCCSRISEFAKRETETRIIESNVDTDIVKNLSALDGVTEDNVSPPQNFIEVCNGDMVSARKMYYKTLQWRAHQGVDRIIETPQNEEMFNNILQYYPHGFQGRTKEGAVVVYEQLGKADASSLSASNVTPEKLLRHFMLRNEFLLTRCHKNFRDGDLSEIELKEESILDEKVSQIMSVLDVKGVGFYSISSDVITFIKISADVMDSHYPNVVIRLAIVNCPSWFSTIWSGIARVLPESVKKKVMFLDDMQGLDEFIDPAMRPPEYGGTGCELCESPDNKAFLALPASWASQKQESTIIDDSSETENVNKANSSGDNRSSVRNWLNGMVSRQDNVKHGQAYMGEANSYRYDVETGSWILQLPDKDGTLKAELDDEKDSHLAKIEEHGLLLAIHAAHEPSASGQIASFEPSGQYSGAGGMYNDLSTADDDSATRPHTLAAIPPAELFLLVVSIHFVISFVYGVLITIVPLWMVSASERGGLEYGVRDCSIAMSSIGIVLMILRASFGQKAGIALKIFPVRALRISAGCVTLFSFALTGFSKLNGSSPWNSPSVHSSSAEVESSRSGAWMMWIIYSVFGHTYTVEADSAGGGGDGLYLHYRPTPASNILSVLIPALFLGVILSCVHISRKATGLLLRISMSSVVSSPLTVERSMSALASILVSCCATVVMFFHLFIQAPFVSCSIFLWAHRYHKPIPMDDSFFLSLIGTSACFVYLSSMFLSVRFRGEFGVMPDDVVASHEDEQHNISSSERRTDGSVLLSNRDFFMIPWQDIKYILAFYPALRAKKKDNPFASRLFNLKLDFKDA